MRSRKLFSFGRKLERFAHSVTNFAGSSLAFAAAVTVVVLWALCGPMYHFSDSWLLTINSFATVVTFLMVFLIQRTQNKSTKAIHLKLNEIIASLEGASNRLVRAEELPEEELGSLQALYRQLADLSTQDSLLRKSFTLEEVKQRMTAGAMTSTPRSSSSFSQAQQ